MITNTIKQLRVAAAGLAMCLLMIVVGLSSSPVLAASDPAADPSACSNTSCDLIPKYVNPLIDTLSVMFGLIAVVSIIFGGIQYSASEGDPQKASQAKNRIAKTVFAIMAYFFLFAFLQFIIPGGAFNHGG